MNKQIYDKIDEIFLDKTNDEFEKFKNDLTFNIKKSYNQMIQSGFSEYIAVAENLDYLTKIESIIKDGKSVDEIKNKLSDENRLKENIDSTVNKDSVNEEYNDEYIENIKKLVEEAKLDIDHLENTSIKEQSDEIVYKEEKVDQKEQTINNNSTTDNSKKEFNSKRYFMRLFSFISVIGLTALVVYLFHLFEVF